MAKTGTDVPWTNMIKELYGMADRRWKTTWIIDKVQGAINYAM